MGTDSGYRTIVHDDNLVGMHNGGCSLGHDKYGSDALHLTDGLTQSCIGGKVQGGGAVIQNQNFRVAHQCSCNGHTLSLTTGEVFTSLGDFKVQTALFLVYKLSGLGSLQCLV